MRLLVIAAACLCPAVAAAQTTVCTPTFGGGVTCNTTSTSLTPGPGPDFGLIKPQASTPGIIQSYEAGRAARSERERDDAVRAAIAKLDAAEAARTNGAPFQSPAQGAGDITAMDLLRGAKANRTPEEEAKAKEALESLKAFNRSLGVSPDDWRNYKPGDYAR